MNIKNLGNIYASQLPRPLYDAIPKSVFAAIAVSSLTIGGDYLECAKDEVIREWWALYDNGIVPQRPTIACPSNDNGVKTR